MRLYFTRGWMAVLFAVLAAVASGCASSSSDVYQKQLAQADAEYKAGKISTTEYFKLKEDAKNTYLASPQNN
jgi:outer membrane lipoprotein SlyB